MLTVKSFFQTLHLNLPCLSLHFFHPFVCVSTSFLAGRHFLLACSLQMLPAIGELKPVSRVPSSLWGRSPQWFLYHRILMASYGEQFVTFVGVLRLGLRCLHVEHGTEHTAVWYLKSLII